VVVVVATAAVKVAREATEAHTEEALTVEDHTAVVLARMALELAVTALAALEEPTTSLLEVTEAQLTVLKVVPEATVVLTQVPTEATAPAEATVSSKPQVATVNKLEAMVVRATLLSPQLLVVLKAATLASSLTVSRLSLALALLVVPAHTALKVTATAVATEETPLGTKRDIMLCWRRILQVS